LGADDERPAPGEQQEPNARAVERLTFFSDAVVAIAITLLAIDLPVPQGATVGDFWASTRANGSAYVAFLFSFAVIAGAWADHHDAFRYIVRGDARLRSFNLLWLLTIVLMPFATRLLLETGKQQPDLDVHALRFGFYALLQVVESAALLAVVRHVIGHRLAASTAKPALERLIPHLYILIIGFALSIPLFFVTADAWLVWIAVPVVAARVIRYLRGNGGGPRDRGRAADRAAG
jgi:uncharacterized membrane protein